MLDFDDTDLTTAVHPSAPVLPVLLALAEQRGMSGRDFVTAMASETVYPSMQAPNQRSRLNPPMKSNYLGLRRGADR